MSIEENNLADPDTLADTSSPIDCPSTHPDISMAIESEVTNFPSANGEELHENMTESAGDEVNISLLISDLTADGMEQEAPNSSTPATNLEDNLASTREEPDIAVGHRANNLVQEIEENGSPHLSGDGLVTTASSEVAQTILPPTAIKSTICVVCNKAQGKYKCPRCELPYCSLTCNTIHKASHPLKEPTPPKKVIEMAPPTIEKNPRAGTGGHQHPFAVLDDSKELAALFKKYPNLPSELLKIERAASTTTTTNGQHGGGRNGRNKGKQQRSGPLNQDPGLQNGLKVLYTARVGDNGEGVREYGKLILQLMAKEEANTLILREQEEESARYVALLLQAES